MRESFTAVIERNAIFTADFATEPYEAGWASEARWFIRVLEIAGEGAALRLTPQISPDGLIWCDEGAPAMACTEPGMVSCLLRGFGQWLRLRGTLAGEAPSVKVLIYLALKE